MKIFCLILFLSSMQILSAQNNTLPYYEMPEPQDNYSSGNIISRMIDGLGYRYHWATKGLTESDLAYKPSDDGRSTYETLVHLHDLSIMILNALYNKPNTGLKKETGLSLEEMRIQTLLNFSEAGEILHNKTEEELSEYKIIFQREDQIMEFPCWYLISGPIADGFYHTGQVVSFRRSNGNPIDPKANVFLGKSNE